MAFTTHITNVLNISVTENGDIHELFYVYLTLVRLTQSSRADGKYFSCANSEPNAIHIHIHMPNAAISSEAVLWGQCTSGSAIIYIEMCIPCERQQKNIAWGSLTGTFSC